MSYNDMKGVDWVSWAIYWELLDFQFTFTGFKLGGTKYKELLLEEVECIYYLQDVEWEKEWERTRELKCSKQTESDTRTHLSVVNKGSENDWK